MLYRSQPGTGGRCKANDGTADAMLALTTGFGNALAARTADPLVLTPLAILDFLCIHPFTDGNGRVARLLSLLLLYRFTYRVGRYISVERIVEESRETYYEALELSSRGWHDSVHDAGPWLTAPGGVDSRLRRVRDSGRESSGIQDDTGPVGGHEQKRAFQHFGH